jgi:hypothetical protein
LREQLQAKIFRLLAGLLGQLEEKYFDYFVFNIIDYIAPLCASAVPCYAWELVVAHSRIRQRSGARHQLAPECGKSPSKTCNFVNISNTVIPTTLEGSTTTSPPIVIVILRK